MKHLLLFLLLLPLGGCYLSRTSQNVPLSPSAIARLVPGESTAQDVTAQLGAPTEVVQLGSRSAYRFDATIEKRTGVLLIVVGLVNTDTRSDRVWVFFDENDLLTHVGATLQAGDSAYALPWVDIHENE